MGNMDSNSVPDERRGSLPSVGAVEQDAAGDKPPLKKPAEGLPSEQLEEAEHDAEDPTHEKKVPPENEK
jgi:hypothetical protein